MVCRVYAEYRDPEAVERSIRTSTTCRCRSPPSAASRPSRRGCGSSSAWSSASEQLRDRSQRFLAARALSAVVAMLAAGMFEYNFGDSEFLMLFLILVTLPFAARERPACPTRSRIDGSDACSSRLDRSRGILMFARLRASHARSSSSATSCSIVFIVGLA